MDIPTDNALNVNPGFGSGQSLDLGNPEVLKEFIRYIQGIIVNDDYIRAYNLAKKLEWGMKQRPDIVNRPSAMANQYLSILALAKGVALPLLSDEQLKEFFRSGIVVALKNPDIDILQKVDVKISSLTFIEQRDDLKKKLRFELRQNYERLTPMAIQTTVGMTAPTVKEWISLAEEKAEEGEPLTVSIVEVENFQKLSPEAQDIVGRLMAIDDLLSLSSSSEEGFESPITIVDENGQRWVYDHGEMRPAVDPETQKLMDKVFKIFQGAPSATDLKVGPTQAQATPSASSKIYLDRILDLNKSRVPNDETRYAAQEELLEKVGVDVDVIVKTLHEALLVHDDAKVLAAVGLLARSGLVGAALEDEKVREGFVEEFLKPLIVSVKLPTGIVAAWLSSHLHDTRTVEAFLQWILKRSLKNDEAESARIGNQIENTIAALGNPDYVGMTYFDVKTGTFMWTPMTLKQDGTLVWKE